VWGAVPECPGAGDSETSGFQVRGLTGFFPCFFFVFHFGAKLPKTAIFEETPKSVHRVFSEKNPKKLKRVPWLGGPRNLDGWILHP
jgi:hypothetical protein